MLYPTGGNALLEGTTRTLLPASLGPIFLILCLFIPTDLVLRLSVEPLNTADKSRFEFCKVGCQQFLS